MKLWAMPVARPYGPDAQRTAEMIKTDFAKIGVDANIVSYPLDEYLSRSSAKDHDGAVLLGWRGDNGDPDNFLGALLGCDAVGANNRAEWCYQPFEDLIRKAKVTSDPAERARLYGEAQAIFMEQVAVGAACPFARHGSDEQAGQELPDRRLWRPPLRQGRSRRIGAESAAFIFRLRSVLGSVRLIPTCPRERAAEGADCAACAAPLEDRAMKRIICLLATTVFAAGLATRRGQDAGLLLGGEPGEFPAGDQHDRHFARRRPRRLQSTRASSSAARQRDARPRREMGRSPTTARRSPSICARASSSTPARTSSRRRDFNADDVLFSFNRQWKDDNPYHKVSGGAYDYFNDMGMPDSCKSIDKIDDYTVKFTLKEPNAPILANLAMDFATILSAEYADSDDEGGNAREGRPGADRHRSVPVRQLPEGCGHPLQGLPEVLGRQGEDRRSGLRDHQGSDGALRQAPEE